MYGNVMSPKKIRDKDIDQEDSLPVPKHLDLRSTHCVICISFWKVLCPFGFTTDTSVTI